jgi:hypothetical protein
MMPGFHRPQVQLCNCRPQSDRNDLKQESALSVVLDSSPNVPPVIPPEKHTPYSAWGDYVSRHASRISSTSSSKLRKEPVCSPLVHTVSPSNSVIASTNWLNCSTPKSQVTHVCTHKSLRLVTYQLDSSCEEYCSEDGAYPVQWQHRIAGTYAGNERGIVV